ncbi:uncharacterized protein LOC135922400 [Gordionus sp. m RMFG-2023]|uniref:uncharacterized protein LOC135922400 n=1 Tax=Gordionus sp. m RMFG-2023 TaxID=3053472 RepID=UPI0031FC2816
MKKQSIINSYFKLKLNKCQATSPLQTTSNTTSEISETDSSHNMNEANLENQEEEDGVGDYGVSLLHFDFKTNKDEEETQSSSSSSSVSHCQEATMSKKSSNGSIQIPGDLGQNKPNQIKLNNYAKKDIHGRQRSFQKSWYRGRDYDEFGQTGFRNWKNALAAKKGLLKHESSKAHLNSITIWHDKNQNINNGTEITKMLGGDQINRNQYYIKSIFDLMLFLSIQELPFRGTGSTNITDAAKDENIIYSSGLFIAMFSYTIQKDPELNKIMKFIPQNAQYTSPQIQNEVISIMADMVLEHISDKYNKSEMPFFCLKADETKDASGCENLSIIIRYIFSGEIQENLIGIINLECLSAESITDCILKQLNDLNINSANIISQAYDGANVMSGRNGGVQTLLQKKLIKMFLLYIATTTSCILWRFNVSCKYTGHTLKRLLDQRWTGHLETSRIIYENFEAIGEVLFYFSNRTLNSEVSIHDSVEASGLLSQCININYIILAIIIYEILITIDPLNKYLQSVGTNLVDAKNCIDSTINILKNKRSDNSFALIMIKAEKLLSKFNLTPQKSSRVRKTPKNFQDFLVDSKLEFDCEKDSNWSSLKRIYYEIIDNFVDRFLDRFTEDDFNLFSSFNTLFPLDPDYFLSDKMAPLKSLLNLNMETLHHEMKIAKGLLASEAKENHNFENILHIMYKKIYNHAFKELYKCYSAAIIIGISTAFCEASFSTLKRVLSSSRVYEG